MASFKAACTASLIAISAFRFAAPRAVAVTKALLRHCAEATPSDSASSTVETRRAGNLAIKVPEQIVQAPGDHLRQHLLDHPDSCGTADLGAVQAEAGHHHRGG